MPIFFGFFHAHLVYVTLCVSCVPPPPYSPLFYFTSLLSTCACAVDNVARVALLLLPHPSPFQRKQWQRQRQRQKKGREKEMVGAGVRLREEPRHGKI